MKNGLAMIINKVCLLVAAVVLAQSTGQAQDSRVPAAIPTRVVAIIPLPGNSEEASGRLSEALSSRLVKLPGYKVLDRKTLEVLIRELLLQDQGPVNPETAKQKGKFYGVDTFVYVSASSAECKEKWVEGTKYFAGYTTHSASVSATMRLTEVETGQIVQDERGRSSGVADEHSVAFDKAFSSLADEFAKRLKASGPAISSTVEDVDTDKHQVFIGIGTDSRVTKGDLFQIGSLEIRVFASGQEVQVFTQVCTARVISVEPAFCSCELVSEARDWLGRKYWRRDDKLISKVRPKMVAKLL